MQDIDEYQLEGYMRSVPRVLESVFVPLIGMINDLIDAKFASK